jgi:molybdate transport system permease protein
MRQPVELSVQSGHHQQFSSPLCCQTRTLPSAIFTYLNQPGGEQGAARLALVSIAIALAALVASEWLARRLKRG